MRDKNANGSINKYSGDNSQEVLGKITLSTYREVRFINPFRGYDRVCRDNGNGDSAVKTAHVGGDGWEGTGGQGTSVGKMK